MDKYISSETFTVSFNSKTYHKVKVTSEWNKIGCLYPGYASKIYTIPEGSYSYDELFNAIINVFQSYIDDNSLDSTISTETRYNVLNKIIFSNISPQLCAVENGIQEIFPFTVALPYSHSTSYTSNIYGQNVVSPITSACFDLFWLSPMFFEPTETYVIEYPNCFIGFSRHLDGDRGEGRTDEIGEVSFEGSWYKTSIYVINGTFNTYGMVMNMVTTFCNNNKNPVYMRPSMEGTDCLIIQRTNTADKNWSMIRCKNVCCDHISNYKIDYYDPNNWSVDYYDRFNIHPNQATSVKKKKFKYNMITDLAYTNFAGEIQNLYYNNVGSYVLYTHNNKFTLALIRHVPNNNEFYSHYASFTIDATFTSTTAVRAFIIIEIDGNRDMAYIRDLTLDDFNSVNKKSIKVIYNRKYYGPGLHRVTFHTNATSLSYVRNEWSAY